MLKKIGRVLVPTLALVTVLGSAGCESQPTEEASLMAALRAENEELRDANSQLESALTERENQLTQVADEREQLIDENTKLRDQLGGGSESIGGFGPGVEVTRNSGEIVVTVAGDVLFSAGSVTLRNDAKTTLNTIASNLNARYATNSIRIAGHTDSDPIRKSKWETNERLSAERALAVEAYLGTRGVSMDRMYAAGFGDAQPRETKARSRRVEIIIID
ncbi:MAG: OmpA family protein [Planctomycetota bacterium]